MGKVEDNAENNDLCRKYCLECPSYPKESDELLFCAGGREGSEVERKGCNCPECPVWMDNGLTAQYYCEKE